MTPRPLNTKRWWVSLALMASGFALGFLADWRAGWLLVVLGNLLLLVECLSRLRSAGGPAQP